MTRLSVREARELGIISDKTAPKSRTRGKGIPGEKETDIQNRIRDYLRWDGWYVIRHQQGLGSHKGLADLQAVKNDRSLFIEVKTATGDLSEDQRDFRDEILPHTGPHLGYLVARSVDDVIRYLREERDHLD